MPLNYSVKISLLFFVLLAMANKVQANSTVSSITVTDAYIKASIPGNNITAAYMTISNTANTATTLQKITSTLSKRIEIHEHSMINDMMHMGKVNNIIINAHSDVVLQPSGLHLMFFSLKQQLSEPESVNVTLHFSNNTKINIQLPVYRYK